LLVPLTGLFHKEPVENVFVGVEIGYDTVNEIVRFVEKVEDYVNLIIIGSLDITTNATKLTTVCDYLYSKDLYFIPFMFLTQFLEKPDFFQFAKEKWGKKFLGIYISDEPGGRQVDSFAPRAVYGAKNYADAATKYIRTLNQGFEHFFSNFVKPINVTTFTSDYALYWFDYKAGYDAVFVEFGWNYSRQLHVALGRGAAEVQNKEWGVIITWTFQNPPYIESAEELYKDLVLAYNNGAKYIVVFNYPTNLTDYGILSEEHLNSLKKFWTYTNVFPQKMKTSSVAFVLPENYGYGFRGPQDKIWGIWGPDELSEKLWNDTNYLLVTFDKQLDLVYDEREFNLEQRYKKLLYWTDTH